MLRFDGTTLDVEAVSMLTVWEGRPAYQVIFRDLSAQKAASAALRCQAALATHVSDAIIATTFTGIVTNWNPAAEAIYRRPAARALALAASEAVGAALRKLARRWKPSCREQVCLQADSKMKGTDNESAGFQTA